MVWRGPNPLTALAAAWQPGDGALLSLVPRAAAIGHAGPGDFFLDRDRPPQPPRRRRRRRLRLCRRRRSSTPPRSPASPTRVFSLNPVWDALLAAGPARRHRASGRLGRRRPPRGHRARRGGAGAVTALPAVRRPAGLRACRPASTSPAALVAGLDARLAGQPPEAVARVEIWVNTRRAQRALGAAFAGGPAAAAAAHPRRHRARRRPARPPACRRRCRRCAASSSSRGWSRGLAAAEPELAAGHRRLRPRRQPRRAPRRDAGRGRRARRLRPRRRRRARRALAAQPALPRR